MGLVDPSGHCAVDANGNIAQNADGSPAKTDCTVDDFQALSWEQRLQWLQIFVDFYGLGAWFNDIADAIGVLGTDADYSRMSGWAAYMDAGVLQAINDGMRLYNGMTAIGNGLGQSGGAAWMRFFSMYYLYVRNQQVQPEVSMRTLNRLIVVRFQAEQAGVDYARNLPESQRRYNRESYRVQRKIDLFLWGADTYRAYGIWCRSNWNVCYAMDKRNAAWTDPRVSTTTFFIAELLAPAPGPIAAILDAWNESVNTCIRAYPYCSPMVHP